MSDQPSADGRNTVSRRRMLKRIGVASAVAWTAPVLTSIRTPAFATSPVCDCPPYGCGQPPRFCPNSDCGCAPHHEGGPCVCFSGSINCNIEDHPICSTDADCVAQGLGDKCVDFDPCAVCFGNVACVSTAGCP
jgi:hypothetical protein